MAATAEDSTCYWHRAARACLADVRRCCRGFRTVQESPPNSRPSRVRRPWFDRTVLVLIVANCVVMASKVSRRTSRPGLPRRPAPLRSAGTDPGRDWRGVWCRRTR